jgi:hypothetical protein
MNKDELMTVELSDEMKAAINNIIKSENVPNNMNLQIGRNNFNGVENLTVLTPNTSNQLNAAISGYIDDFSNEFYNLIVTNTELLNENCITIKIPYSTAIKLDYGTSPEVYKIFKDPNKETQKQIKDFPTLVIDKNALNSNLNKTYAIVCKITNIKYEMDNTVSFTLFKVKEEPYTKEFLLANSSNLDIRASKGVTELDEVHWAIKKADLKTKLNLEGVI